MNHRDVAVVLVAYGRPDLVEMALQPVRAERVIVVDNSSSTEIRAVAADAGATYVDPGHNLGFAAAVNLALANLRQAGFWGDVLLLNPDAVISSPQIRDLQTQFTTPDGQNLAAVSPRLRSDADGVGEQRVAWPFPAPRAMWREALQLSDRRPSPGFVVGAVLLLRAEALADVGDFDERYFLYAEETDWQRRAADRGWRSGVASNVEVEHIGAATSVDSRRRDELFHAGQETYVRKWFGWTGWQSYRLSALIGSLLRCVVGSDDSRARARHRLRLYAVGPRKVAGSLLSGRLRVTHMVVTGNQAGTERYVAQTASNQVELGLEVTVIGGAPEFMAAALHRDVRWLRGSTLASAAASLLRVGKQDVVHSHLTSADFVTAALRWWHRGKVVSTRHIASPRGKTVVNRALARVLENGVDQEVAISHFVAAGIQRPSVVVHNGVEIAQDQPTLGRKRMLIVQRLEPEKATAVGLEAWAQAALGRAGWTLEVCGEGSDLHRLRAAYDDPSIAWSGWVKDIRMKMLSADALLATAPLEPLGLSVLEAMSVGLPVLAASGGGHLETVARNGGEMMFIPGDVNDCARVLHEFSVMRMARARELGERLRKIQQADFAVATQVAALSAVYTQLSKPTQRNGPLRR